MIVPTISIITVTFNASSELTGLAGSLRAQSDRDFEWVVVDGASTDGTVELIKSANDVVSRWISEPDCGIYDAMNKAIHLASGEYYLVCGADDRLYPNAIADYRRIANKASADIISAYVQTKSGITSPLRGRPWLRGHLAFVSQHSVGSLIRKSLHARIGYYSRRFPIAADQYFLKLACMDSDVRIVPADFVAGYYSAEGISATDIAGTLSDFFRVQLETERFISLQVLLHGLRLISHLSGIIAFLKSKRLGKQ